MCMFGGDSANRFCTDIVMIFYFFFGGVKVYVCCCDCPQYTHCPLLIGQDFRCITEFNNNIRLMLYLPKLSKKSYISNTERLGLSPSITLRQ